MFIFLWRVFRFPRDERERPRESRPATDSSTAASGRRGAHLRARESPQRLRTAELAHSYAAAGRHAASGDAIAGRRRQSVSASARGHRLARRRRRDRAARARRALSHQLDEFARRRRPAALRGAGVPPPEARGVRLRVSPVYGTYRTE